MAQKYRWYSVKEKPFPEEQGVYKCTLNNGKVYRVFCGRYANGWSWDISREIKIEFNVEELGEPEIIAWFPNPEPYSLEESVSLGLPTPLELDFDDMYEIPSVVVDEVDRLGRLRLIVDGEIEHITDTTTLQLARIVKEYDELKNRGYVDETNISYVKPIKRDYSDKYHLNYYKYTCPICDNMFGNKHQVIKGDMNCVMCGINLLWEDAEDDKNDRFSQSK